MKIKIKSKVLFLVIFFACFSQQVINADDIPNLGIHPILNANEIVVVEEPSTVDDFERVLLYMAVTDKFEFHIPYENPMKIDKFPEKSVKVSIINNCFDAWYNVGAKYPEYFEFFRRIDYETYEVGEKVIFKIIFYSDDFNNPIIVDMKYKFLEKTEDAIKNLIKTKSLTKEMTDRKKAEVLYEWIAVNNFYDLGYKDNPVSFNGYGLIEYNEGVCSAYTSVYNLMLKMVGIKEVEGIVGTAGIGDDIEGHIWTRANLDGEILYIDSTWGDPVPDTEDYCDFSYFAVNEDYLSRNYHYWDKERYERSHK